MFEAGPPDSVQPPAPVPSPPVEKKKFPSLEDQKLVDLALKRLNVELEAIDAEELKRVQALGYDGGVKVAAVGGSMQLQMGDLLVGLHVWPTTSMKDVATVLERDDLAELNPLKFYVVRQELASDLEHPNGITKDFVHTGRLTVQFEDRGWGDRRRNSTTKPTQPTPAPAATYTAPNAAKPTTSSSPIPVNSSSITVSTPSNTFPSTPNPTTVPTANPNLPLSITTFPTAAEPVRSATELPPGASPIPTNTEELDILRERVKSFEEQFNQIDTLYKKSAKGGGLDKLKPAAYELAVAKGELLLAEGNREAAIAEFKSARTYAEEALKAMQDSYAAGNVTLDALQLVTRNLSDIKLKLIRLQREPRINPQTDKSGAAPVASSPPIVAPSWQVQEVRPAPAATYTAPIASKPATFSDPLSVDVSTPKAVAVPSDPFAVTAHPSPAPADAPIPPKYNSNSPTFNVPTRSPLASAPFVETNASKPPAARTVVAYEIPPDLKKAVDQYSYMADMRGIWDDRNRFVVQATKEKQDAFKALVDATAKWRDPAAVSGRAARPFERITTKSGGEVFVWHSVGLTLGSAVEDGSVVTVSSVAPGSPAAWQDIRSRDVLTQLETFNTDNLPEVEAILTTLRGGFDKRTATVAASFRRTDQDGRNTYLNRDLPLRPDDAAIPNSDAGRGRGMRYTPTAPSPPEASATKPQKSIFTEVDGEVQEVLVEHGDLVKKGQVLLVLRSPALEADIASVNGEYDKNLAKREAIERASSSNDKLPLNERRQRAVDRQKVLETLKNLQQQLDLLQEKQSKLQIRSPIDGRVVTWNPRDQLLHRPVRSGQSLLEIASAQTSTPLTPVPLPTPPRDVPPAPGEHSILSNPMPMPSGTAPINSNQWPRDNGSNDPYAAPRAPTTPSSPLVPSTIPALPPGTSLPGQPSAPPALVPPTDAPSASPPPLAPTVGPDKSNLRDDRKNVAAWQKAHEAEVVRKSNLRYDGKTFEAWRNAWQTELSTEKRSEAVKALAAFGRAGYGKEAVDAILDVAGQYDFKIIEGNERPEGKLKETILEELAPQSGAPQSLATQWVIGISERMGKDPKKWKWLAAHLFSRLHTSDPRYARRTPLFRRDRRLSVALRSPQCANSQRPRQ